MRRNHQLLGLLTAAVMCATMLPMSASAAAGETFVVPNPSDNNRHQYTGTSEGASYEIWLDQTGGSGSMTLGKGGTFNTEWNCSVSQGNFLARRGTTFDRSKKATDIGNITLDYAAEYSASSEGNSRLCVYGWTVEPLVEYYIIEDWVNWCPSGPSTTVTIDGAEYDIFTIEHTGPTILGDTRTFPQYFSVRKDKRTSGKITVSDHFKAWENAGMTIGNLTEVALNVEGWESSGKANVSKLDLTVGGTLVETDPPIEAPSTEAPATEAPTAPANGIYLQDDFTSGAGKWTGRGDAQVAVSDGTLAVTNRSDNWHGAAITLDPKTYIPGNSYSFSVEGMQNAAASDTLKLTLQYSLNGKDNYDNVAEAAANKGEWVQLANTEFTIPAGATNMILYVEADSKTNSFFIDNATIATKGTKIAASGSSSTTPTSGKLMGDVNANGSLEITDVIVLQKKLLGFKQVINNENSDMNADGVIDVFDLVLVKRAVLNKKTSTDPQQPVTEAPTEATTEAPTEPTTQRPSGQSYMSTIKDTYTLNVPSNMTSSQAGVDYGKLEPIEYYSTIAKKNKKANVLLPAGYDSSKKYPVLYVNHGIFGDCQSMLDDGMGVIKLAGNLAAAGEAEQMIIVFTSMYTSATTDQCAGINAEETARYDAFREDITECLIPYINEHYSTKTGRENTAISGFSMGGRESLYIGMTKPEVFGYIGAACPAPGVVPAQDMMTHPGNMSKEDFYVHGDIQPTILFIAAGTNDTVVQKFPQEYDQLLTQNGQEHLWLEVPGGGHDGSVVVPMFYNFLRTVFKG